MTDNPRMEGFIRNRTARLVSRRNIVGSLRRETKTEPAGSTDPGVLAKHPYIQVEAERIARAREVSGSGQPPKAFVPAHTEAGDSVIKHGKLKAKTKRKHLRIQVVITPELDDLLRKAVIRSGLSTSELIRAAVFKYLG